MSYLTESTASLRRQVIAALEGEGFAFNPLTTTFPQYLATCLGQASAWRTKSVNRMLAELNTAFGGDTVSHLTMGYAQLLDTLNTTLADSGGGGDYEGPLDIVSGSVAAYGQRALSAAKRGTALYTVHRISPSASSSFNSDAVTGDAPSASITTFIGSTIGLSAAVTADTGSGYDDGTFDVTLVGGTGTAAVVNVTAIDGQIDSVNSITSAGSYSVAPTSPVETDAGANPGTGLTLACLFRVGTISTWVDQSGDGNDVVADTGGEEPEWLASVQSGKPGLFFATDGFKLWNRMNTAGAVTFPGEVTVFAVVRAEFGPNADWIVGLNNNNSDGDPYWEFGLRLTDPDVYHRADMWDGTNQAGSSHMATTGHDLGTGLHIIDTAWEFGAGGSDADGDPLVYNGDMDSGGAVGSISKRLSVGAGDAGATPPRPWSGHLIELLVYPSRLSDGDRALVRANIADYYGITLV